jgi:hypothetical protein
MALTLVQLAEAIRKYGDRGTFSAHDKAAFERNLDLFVGRAGSVEKALSAVRQVAEPTFDVPSSYFTDGGNEPYLAPDPGSLPFTASLAIEWWKDVMGHGLNIGKVRSVFTPGSHVLTDEGLAAARLLGSTSLNFAPEDYNPLGLTPIA